MTQAEARACVLREAVIVLEYGALHESYSHDCALYVVGLTFSVPPVNSGEAVGVILSPLTYNS